MFGVVARSSAQDAPPWEVPAAHGAVHVGAAHVGVKRWDPAVCVRALGHSLGYPFLSGCACTFWPSAEADFFIGQISPEGLEFAQTLFPPTSPARVHVSMHAIPTLGKSC